MIMKKIYAIFAAAAATFALAASCNKIETNEPGSEPVNGPAEGVKVNITVGSLTPDTKAVKTGWENGDIIHVYLDDASTYTPDFDLTYDGSKWSASTLSAAVIDRLKEDGTGYIRGFWEESNYCMTGSSWDKYSYVIEFPGTANYGTTGITSRLVADFHGIKYTYDKAAGTLTASIGTWRFRSNFQLVVNGLDFEAGRYTLYSDDVANLHMIPIETSGTAEDKDCQASYYGTGSAYGRIAGIQNADGVAFVGAFSTSSYIAGETLTFYLIDNTTGVKYEFTKTLAATLSTPDTKVTAIRVPFSKFVVDMGLSVKWAACNLGAATVTGYGDYYAWGETEPYYEDGYADENPQTHWKTGKTGYDWASYQWTTDGGSSFTKYTGSDYDTLQAADDAATAAYGSPYRMPTDAEFQELLNASNCDREWVANYLSTGVNGYLFTGKKSGYESQKLFLPAAGYRYYTYLFSVGSNGDYWSSSLSTGYPDGAWSVFFNSVNVYRGSYDRYGGQSVRPVFAE